VKTHAKNIPNPQNQKIWEKQGIPNVAKHVTGAYFGLSKYALYFSQVFFCKRLKNTPGGIRTPNPRFRRLMRYRVLIVS